MGGAYVAVQIFKRSQEELPTMQPGDIIFCQNVKVGTRPQSVHLAEYRPLTWVTF
jgi:hypothetical protein